ncbi:MAG TPA: hypothetical protein VFA07_18600 [Chthonomonadaceae bacterium]|nr:hypothetical protein [Chthonomonadaceae bacterium]
MTALLNATDNALIDGILEGIVTIYDLAFAGQIRALYLTGSWSNGTGVYHPGDAYNSSDLDLHIVFGASSAPEEKERARQFLGACRQISPVGLDGYLCREEDLEGYWDTSLKQSSLLLYGDDIRDAITLPALEDHIQRVLTFPPYCLAEPRHQLAEPRHQQEPCLLFPLSYPDPEGEFYGYDHVEASHSIRPSTRALVGSVTWAATVMLAIQAGCYAGNKRDAVHLYREHIHDAWSDLIETVFDQCKLTWQFRVPEKAADRRHLRQMCRQMPGLENHLLSIYRTYLLQELAQPEEERQQFAIEMLGQVIFLDEEVSALMQQYILSPRARLQAAAHRTLEKIDHVRSTVESPAMYKQTEEL